MSIADAGPVPETARALRRDFLLPEEDTEFLEATGLDWEAAFVTEGGAQALWIFVHDLPLSRGFVDTGKLGVALATATAGFRVTGYPGAALDMVYLDPPVARADGRGINALSTATIDGRTFQQWSRHYQFQPGIDSFTSHFRAAQNWLENAARP